MKLEKRLADEIVKLILSRKKVDRIVLFGSRVNGQSRKTSDIDLAILAKNLTATDISLIKDDLEENIKTPLKIDVIHFEGLTKQELKDEILKEGVILYESKTS